MDTSPEFYRRNAERYAEVAHGFLQSVYVESSHPSLTNDSDLISRARALAPGHRCLDAGCGAGARDVYALWRTGCDAVGIDAVAENILAWRSSFIPRSPTVSLSRTSHRGCPSRTEDSTSYSATRCCSTSHEPTCWTPHCPNWFACCARRAYCNSCSSREPAY